MRSIAPRRPNSPAATAPNTMPAMAAHDAGRGPDLGGHAGRHSTGGLAAMRRRAPKGLAFAIEDLLLIQGWAEARDVTLRILLDHGTPNEEYEEVVAMHTGTPAVCRAIMWRNAGSVFVQPLVGRRRHYARVADALESLLPARTEVLTDIVATRWPG
jgi:hypothetical protein